MARTLPQSARRETRAGLRQQELVLVSHNFLFCDVAKVEKTSLALIGIFATEPIL